MKKMVAMKVSGCGVMPIDPRGCYCKPCQRGEPCPVKPAQVAACREWIRDHARPVKRINARFGGSYQLKHTVESWSRARGVELYISNGSFIAAALAEGYRAKRLGMSATFNMSKLGGRESA